MSTIMKRKWEFTDHALSRGASRVGLLIDETAKREIGESLDSIEALLVTDKNRKGCSLYEIPLFGSKVICVVNTTDRVVITFLDPKRWYYDRQVRARRRRHVRPEPDHEEHDA
jgi:hypothetical protein